MDDRMNQARVALPCALTVAGSDSGGGAGLQADLRTLAALEVYGTSAVTAVTAQNTRGVNAFEAVSPALVKGQIEAVLDDLPIVAAKTGMLANAEVTLAVAEALGGRDLPLVVDPVLVATSGDRLLDEGGMRAVKERLIPLAHVVTPNLPEASWLCGFEVETLDDQLRAGEALCALGARSALVKGGHADGDPTDVLVHDKGFALLTSTRIETTSTHGTGCTLSAAIVAGLAHGKALLPAVRDAHAYLRAAILDAPGLGGGRGPVHHMHPHYPATRARSQGQA
jgi:hydroxymethylpyrimidine/phosphomethylpyrimidine kinase